MKTTENNKIIAEFMKHKQTFEVFINNEIVTLQNPIKEYNTDWNWLMQVVEKCFKIEANYGLHKNIEDALIFNSENRINDVYNAVVKFIEVYNESFKQEAVYSIRDNSAKNN